MKLYLLRHGLADPRDPRRFANDDLRPLVARGREQARMAGRTLRARKIDIDLIWFSPLARAHQTAIAVAEAMAMLDRANPQDALAPEGDRDVLLGRINAIVPPPASLMLVGHEPSLSRLLSYLVAGTAELSVRMKKGGLARLTIDEAMVTAGCATLEWLIPPPFLAVEDERGS
jgi:phosphohistidine phosphatase